MRRERDREVKGATSIALEMSLCDILRMRFVLAV